MRPLVARLGLALTTGAALASGMTWLDQQRFRVFESSMGHVPLLLSWVAIAPLLVASGRAATAVSRRAYRGAVANEEGPVVSVESPYREGAAVLAIISSSILFVLNFGGMNMTPFLWPWKISVAVAALLPVLMPPRVVGIVAIAGGTLCVDWEDGATFRVPLRSVDKVSQLLEPNDFPFERVGQGTWKPLVVRVDDEHWLRALIDDEGRLPASRRDRPSRV